MVSYFYDIESLDNVFTLANYRSDADAVDIYYLVDDEALMPDELEFKKNATDRILQFKRSAGVICRCEVNKFNTHMDRSDLIGTLMEKKPEMVFRFVKGCFEMCNKDLASLRE